MFQATAILGYLLGWSHLHVLQVDLTGVVPEHLQRLEMPRPAQSNGVAMRACTWQKLWSGSTSMCAPQVNAVFQATQLPCIQLPQHSLNFLKYVFMHDIMKYVACRRSGIAY